MTGRRGPDDLTAHCFMDVRLHTLPALAVDTSAIFMFSFNGLCEDRGMSVVFMESSIPIATNQEGLKVLHCENNICLLKNIWDPL